MAVCVVCYGISETVFGEWSVMGSTIILVHSYYNVWLRAQLGWQSFLLRRDAVNKIKSLPTATDAQLQQYNDICAICFQVSRVFIEFRNRLFFVFILPDYTYQLLFLFLTTDSLFVIIISF